MKTAKKAPRGGTNTTQKNKEGDVTPAAVYAPGSIGSLMLKSDQLLAHMLNQSNQNDSSNKSHTVLTSPTLTFEQQMSLKRMDIEFQTLVAKNNSNK